VKFLGSENTENDGISKNNKSISPLRADLAWQTDGRGLTSSDPFGGCEIDAAGDGGILYG
jgi:hypothetical protein